jgi:hypothetical protein
LRASRARRHDRAGASSYLAGATTTIAVDLRVPPANVPTPIEVGLYSDSGGAPASRLTETGPQSVTAGLNRLVWSAPAPIDAGTYWVAIQSSSATAFTAEPYVNYYFLSTPYAPLPATAAGATPTSYQALDIFIETSP